VSTGSDAPHSELLSIYIPVDRRQALVRNLDLPDRPRGAALFADVSGFTPLTEALARDLGPKRGAEELTRTLNAIFDALIAEVDRFRGSVIIFGGDAITCWFNQDDGRRATACGLAMQQAMRQFASIRTPSGGTVSMAMKAAVATGAVRRFRVGDPAIQLLDVLAGATLDEMSSAEHHAERGDVVLAPSAAAQLQGAVEIREWREGEDGRFAVVDRLRRPVEAEPWSGATGPLDQAQFRPWLLLPVYERLMAGQAQFLAEIRPTVSLFLKFGGIDYDADPAAGERLDAYLRWAQGILTTYDGFMLQVLMGDKGSHFYATFGAPVAHDDDPARGIAAALELIRPPAELSFVRDTQIGLSRGRMWAGAYGGTTRRTYGVLGDAVNLSARLMAKAAPGQILVSQPMVEAAGQAYDFESIGLVQVKGKAEPLPVSRVVGRREYAAQRSMAYFETPMVGRESELAQLVAFTGRALEGRGQIIRLQAGPGLGKSHLSAECVLDAANRGARICIGACLSTSQAIAYTPWRQVFRLLLNLTGEAPADPAAAQRQAAQVEEQLRRVNSAWLLRLPLLGDLLGLDIPDNAATAAFDARLRQEALFALAVEMLQTWARVQPLAIWIEDAHWMDEASTGLTLALGRVLARLPVLLLLVQRPPSRDDQPLLPELNRLAHHHLLELKELTPDGVAALVHNRLGAPASPLVMGLVLTQAQGNPFFTQELVNTLRETNSIYHHPEGDWRLAEPLVNTLRDANMLANNAEGRWTLIPNAQLSVVNLGIPDSVQGVVLSRLDRLPEMQKGTLKVASIIGRVFEFEILIGAHPGRPNNPELLDQLEALETREFTRTEAPPPHLTYIFRHNITAEVTYETLLEAQQRDLHRGVGEALERAQPEAVERLAYHFSRAQIREKALLYLDKSARKAQADYANETALNYYTQALALEERWEWRRGQIEVLHILGRREEEKAALQTLTASALAPAFEAAYLWGQYYEAVGDYAEAHAAVQRALRAARASDDRISEARCLAQLGLIARRQGDYERAKSEYSPALSLFPEGETLSNEAAQVLAWALTGLGLVYRQQGAYDEALRCYERALTISRATGNRRGEAEALNGLGGTAYYQRSLPEALRYHQQALEIRQAIGDRAGEGVSVLNLAQISVALGDYGDGERFFQAALSIQQAIGNRWEESNVWNGLGVLYQDLGDLDRAQACLEQGYALSRDLGDEAGQAYFLANLGVVARDRGELDASEALLQQGLALARAQDDLALVSYFYSYLGTVSGLAGRYAQAIERATLALDLRRKLNLDTLTTGDLATLAAAERSLKNLAGAQAYAWQARRILDECGGEGPEFPHRDYFVCYQVFLAAGETEAARTALDSAHRLVRARAEKIVDPALRESFLQRVRINHDIVSAFTRA
jgi:predicted ATPase/class 3 adenylate cyclase